VRGKASGEASPNNLGGKALAYLKYFDFKEMKSKYAFGDGKEQISSPFNGGADPCKGFQDLASSSYKGQDGHSNIDPTTQDKPIGDPITVIDVTLPAITLFGVISINIVIQSHVNLGWAWDINTAAGVNKLGTTTKQYVRALVGALKPKVGMSVSIAIEAAAGFDATFAKLKAALGVRGTVNLFTYELPASMIINIARIRQIISEALIKPGSYPLMTTSAFKNKVAFSPVTTMGSVIQSTSSAYATGANKWVVLKLTPTMIGLGLGVKGTFLDGKVEGYINAEASFLGMGKKKEYTMEFASWPGIKLPESGDARELMSCDVCDTSGNQCPLYNWQLGTASAPLCPVGLKTCDAKASTTICSACSD
jgi:hypothetical protein